MFSFFYNDFFHCHSLTSLNVHTQIHWSICSFSKYFIQYSIFWVFFDNFTPINKFWRKIRNIFLRFSLLEFSLINFFLFENIFKLIFLLMEINVFKFILFFLYLKWFFFLDLFYLLKIIDNFWIIIDDRIMISREVMLVYYWIGLIWRWQFRKVLSWVIWWLHRVWKLFLHWGDYSNC